MNELKLQEAIHIFEQSQLVSDNFTQEALTATYVIALAAIRHAAPENNSLTLEQLKGMQSEPVWVKTGEVAINEQIIGRYEIIHSISDLYMACMGGGTGFRLSDYGRTWLAYARKPEREEKVMETVKINIVREELKKLDELGENA